MTKKKQKKQGQQFLSPEQYIKQKARSLEIGACYVSDDIEEMGEGHVIVSRKHTGGRVSMAVYLVDIWCVGVKDSFYRLRLEDDEFKEMIDTYRLGLRECSYLIFFAFRKSIMSSQKSSASVSVNPLWDISLRIASKSCIFVTCRSGATSIGQATMSPNEPT